MENASKSWKDAILEFYLHSIPKYECRKGTMDKVSACPMVGRATQILKLAAHPQPHLWKVPTQECYNTYKHWKTTGKKRKEKSHWISHNTEKENTFKRGRGDNQERKHRAWLLSSSILVAHANTKWSQIHRVDIGMGSARAWWRGKESKHLITFQRKKSQVTVPSGKSRSIRRIRPKWS